MSAPVRPASQEKADAPSDSATFRTTTTPKLVAATPTAILAAAASAPSTAVPAATKTIQTARIVSHPTATTLTLIGSGPTTNLMRPATAAGVTSFHISKAPAAIANRSVVAAPIVAGFASTPIITTATIPATSRPLPRASATALPSGPAWLSGTRPTPPQARITTYPIGAIRPVIPTVSSNRPILATFAKQELPTVRTQMQEKSVKGAKTATVAPGKEITHVAVAAAPPTLQSVVVSGQPGVVKPLNAKPIARVPDLKPTTCVLQTLAPITHLAGIKSAPRAQTFIPATTTTSGQQLKVLTAGDQISTPTTVISSTSLLIHNTLTGVERAPGTTSVATLPASYFYESGQPLTTVASGRLVMTPVTTAPAQVKLQTVLSSFEEKPKITAPSVMPTTSFEPVSSHSTQYKTEIDEALEEASNSLLNLSPTKLSASPRPSILRKRDHEGSPTKPTSKVVPFTGFGQSGSPPSSPVPKPDSDDGKENSSGGSSTISATSSPGLLDIENMVMKSEPDASIGGGSGENFSNNGFGEPVSPRKKPRKQQLSGNELQEVFEEAKDECKKKGGEVAAKIGGARRRSALLLPNYRTNTKLCHNHFRRPTDVRIREERRPTVAELSSQKGVAQKARGWKLYHLSTQMEVMSDREGEILDRFGNMLNDLDTPDSNRTSELIRSNMQRSKVVRDQLNDCRAQLLKLLDHGKPVLDIIRRHANRRQAKKKY